MSTNSVEAMARAIHQERQSAGFGGKATWDYEPVDIRALHLQTARVAILAYHQWLEKNGLVVVPREITEDMANAMECEFSTEGQWQAALAAAPDMLGEKP